MFAIGLHTVEEAEFVWPFCWDFIAPKDHQTSLYNVGLCDYQLVMINACISALWIRKKIIFFCCDGSNLKNKESLPF